ncbi:MAG: hypothetical protein ACE5KZ_15415 [Candidatus Scalinduaceae bacterium]
MIFLNKIGIDKERRLGEMLKEQKKNVGGRPEKTGSTKGPVKSQPGGDRQSKKALFLSGTLIFLDEIGIDKNHYR